MLAVSAAGHFWTVFSLANFFLSVSLRRLDIDQNTVCLPASSSVYRFLVYHKPCPVQLSSVSQKFLSYGQIPSTAVNLFIHHGHACIFFRAP